MLEIPSCHFAGIDSILIDDTNQCGKHPDGTDAPACYQAGALASPFTRKNNRLYGDPILAPKNTVIRIHAKQPIEIPSAYITHETGHNVWQLSCDSSFMTISWQTSCGRKNSASKDEDFIGFYVNKFSSEEAKDYKAQSYDAWNCHEDFAVHYESYVHNAGLFRLLSKYNKKVGEKYSTLNQIYFNGKEYPISLADISTFRSINASIEQYIPSFDRNAPLIDKTYLKLEYLLNDISTTRSNSNYEQTTILPVDLSMIVQLFFQPLFYYYASPSSNPFTVTAEQIIGKHDEILVANQPYIENIDLFNKIILGLLYRDSYQTFGKVEGDIIALREKVMTDYFSHESNNWTTTMNDILRRCDFYDLWQQRHGVGGQVAPEYYPIVETVQSYNTVHDRLATYKLSTTGRDDGELFNRNRHEPLIYEEVVYDYGEAMAMRLNHLLLQIEYPDLFPRTGPDLYSPPGLDMFLEKTKKYLEEAIMSYATNPFTATSTCLDLTPSANGQECSNDYDWREKYLTAMEQLLFLQTDDSSLAQAQSVFWLRFSQYKTAAHFQKAFGNVYLTLALGTANNEEKDRLLNSAVSNYEKVFLLPDSDEVLVDKAYSQYRIGVCREEQGNINESKNAYQKTIDNYPDSYAAWFAQERLLAIGD